MPDRPWLIVLARDPHGAKTRLGELLTEDERARLVVAMLEDVVDAATGSGLARVVIATESDQIRELARAHGIADIQVPARGTNEAARDSFAASSAAGATSAAVVSADLPALQPEDVTALFETVGPAHAAVAIAPDRHGRGTNALFLRPTNTVVPRFGPESYRAHRDAAARAGLEPRVVDRPGLALDIDTADDLRYAMEQPDLLGRRSAEVIGMLSLGSGRPPGAQTEELGPRSSTRARGRALPDRGSD